MELFANTGPVPIASLTSGLAAGAGNKSLAASLAAPAPLLAAGTFRIYVDAEIMLVTAGASGTTWTVERAQEGTSAETHASGAKIYHYLTGGSLLQAIKDYSSLPELVVEGGSPSSVVTEKAFGIDFGSPKGTTAYFQVKRGYATGSGKSPEWENGSVLQVGEIGWEINTGKLKFGEEKTGGGLKTWAELGYAGLASGYTTAQADEKFLGIEQKGPLVIKGTASTTNNIPLMTVGGLKWEPAPKSGAEIAEIEKLFIQFAGLPANSKVILKGAPTAGQIPVFKKITTGVYECEWESPASGVEGTPGPEQVPYTFAGSKLIYANINEVAIPKFNEGGKLTASQAITGNNYYVVEGTAAVTLTLPEASAMARSLIGVYNLTNNEVILKAGSPQIYTAAGLVTEIKLKKKDEGVLLLGSTINHFLVIGGFKSLAMLEEVFLKRGIQTEALDFSLTGGDAQFIAGKHSTDANYRIEADTGGKTKLGTGAAAPDTIIARGTRVGEVELTGTGGAGANGAVSVGGAGRGQTEAAFLGSGKLGGAEPLYNTAAGLIYKIGDLVFDRDTGITWICYAAGIAGGVSNNEETGTKAKWRVYTGKSAYSIIAGYVAQTFDSAVLTPVETALTSEILFLSKMPLPSGSTKANFISVYLSTAATAATLTYARAAIFNSAGELKAESADMSTKWATSAEVGIIKMATEASPTIEGAFCWLGLLAKGTTMPKFSSSPNINYAQLNGNNAKAEARVGLGPNAFLKVENFATSTIKNKEGALMWGAIS